MGTITSLMKSPISSVLMRFSMLSLTFCSWPERVCMTNHWLRMLNPVSSNVTNQQREHEIDCHGKRTKQNDCHTDQQRGTLQFVPGWPGALSQFFFGLRHIGSKTVQVA